MTNYSILAQIAVSLSVLYVWTFRFDNVVKEFQLFGLSPLTRSLVGAAKIALSALLVAGIWFQPLVPFSALGLAFFMVCAQYFHFKCGNPWQKHIPSLILLLLCLSIAAVQ
jgi:hypothetical protein